MSNYPGRDRRERWHHLHMLTRTPTRMEGMRMDLCMHKHKNSPHLEQFPQSIAPEKDLFSFSKKYWVCSVIQLSLENASERSSSEYAENTQTHHPHTVNIKTRMRINSLHIKNTHKLNVGCLFNLFVKWLHQFILTQLHCMKSIYILQSKFT